MLTLTYTAALAVLLGAIAGGALVGWTFFRLRATVAFITIEVHREELLAMRRRYRHRLRTLRDAMRRQHTDTETLRSEAQAATAHQATQAKLLAAANTEIAALAARVRELEADLRQRQQEATAALEREQQATGELGAALERLAAFERDHGLLRIERDELAAQTARLRMITVTEPGAPDSAVALPATPESAPRTALADRDARIHELQCQLRERESRMAELESSLRTWKYRIAPMAVHLQRQREAVAARKVSVTARDDLGRIHGIGPVLEKKLRGAGVTRFAQLADLSPAELANLAVRLGLAPSRPQRERWAEQARDLCAGPAADAAGRGSSGA